VHTLVILRAAKRSRRIHAAVDEHTPMDSATSRGMTSRTFVMYLYVAQQVRLKTVNHQGEEL
jgi:hypothetical protein